MKVKLTIPLGELIKRSLLCSFGLAIFALGNYMTIKANIGQSPWNVFNLGLNNYIPITFGQISIVVSALVVITDILLKEHIGIGTILDAVLVGIFYDIYDSWNLIPVIENFWVGFVVMIAGLVVLDISEAIYMKAGLGCGPRDALMVGVGKRLRKLPIGAVSVLISLVVLTIGWILGGSVGLGTLIFMFCGGIVMQIVFKIIRFEPRDITHVGLHQMLKFEKK